MKIMSGRFEELDSLRGIAAVTVVINHHLNVLPSVYDKTVYQSDQWWLEALKYSPLHIFWAGHEAVVFFFVISGFVLSLPYFKRRMAYAPFIFKRISRIYLPYIVAVCAAVMLSVIFSRGGIAALSSWFNNAWASPVSMKQLLNHLLLIGTFDNGELNPVLWSLVHEMRISIIFPAILYIIMRFEWKAAIGIAFSCSCLSFISSMASYRLTSYNPDFFLTLHYVSMFIIGALLAKHRDALTGAFGRISRMKKLCLLTAAILAYTYKWWFFHNTRLFHISIIDDWAVAAGVCIFIVFALSSKKASALLLSKPLLLCGKVSYSLYLYHAIVLLTAINILFGVLPLWQIWMLSLAATFALSTLMYRLVEVPSIKIGRMRQSKAVNAMPLTENLQPEQASA
jgi:peptidoglycan/LPS O-acetylase OafA/YrhL